MLIFIQYPIADLRLFMGKETGRLHSPLWPAPKPRREFVRSFGMIRKRGKGGIQGWIGENEICDARHAVKFESPILYFPPLRTESQALPPGIKCSSRHFYFDGTAVAKLELVFVTIPSVVNPTPQEFSHLFFSLLETRVEVPGSVGGSRKVSLRDLGSAFAESYLRSTTAKKYLNSIEYVKWAKAGEPIFWVEFSQKETLPPLSKARKVSTNADDAMSFYHWQAKPHKHDDINTWLAKRQTDAQTGSEISRAARIILTRLSSEREVFWAVLDMLEHGRIGTTPNSADEKEAEALEHLQRYFNESTRRIFKLMRSESRFFEPDQLGEDARGSLESIEPGRTDALFQTLERLRIRPQVEKKVRDVIQIFISEVYMGDNVHGKKVTRNISKDRYNVSGGVVIGGNAQANNVQVTIENKPSTELDYKKLAEELIALREEMQHSANSDEHRNEIEQVELAQHAAEMNNKTVVQNALHNAGSWALTVAEKIGTPLAIAALKNSLGIP